MARRLRNHVRGGWYHITTRGLGRRDIFHEDRDRLHFLELLSELVDRYGVILHAYVLLDNHYHLLIETPFGNASRALQWLNVSYAVWHNVKHRRSGPLFQARYKSIPVEEQGSWALMCSIYLHLNPVRIRAMGLGKAERARDKAGVMPEGPPPEVIARRLAKLRGYRWSSYPAYAGYAVAPEWLTRTNVWQRVARAGDDAAAAYRKQIEDYLKQGMQEGVSARLTQALAIGSTAFLEKLRLRLAKRTGAWTNARAWRRLLPFKMIVRAVETVKQASWKDFADCRGDWGRDLALYIGRRHSGMTLLELGKHAEMTPQAVSQAATRMHTRLSKDRTLRRSAEKVLRLAHQTMKEKQ
ncbi:MAG: transposase [Magnetococcus sp. WYHC-3]